MKKLLFLLFSISFLTAAIILLPQSKAQNTSCDVGNVENVCKDGLSSECSDLLNQCQSSISQALQDLRLLLHRSNQNSTL